MRIAHENDEDGSNINKERGAEGGSSSFGSGDKQNALPGGLLGPACIVANGLVVRSRIGVATAEAERWSKVS